MRRRAGSLAVLVAGWALVWAAPAWAHKYSSCLGDVRVVGDQLQVEMQIDTVATMEMLQDRHAGLQDLRREGVVAYRDEVYAYLNDRLVFRNGDLACTPSAAFGFSYLPQPDRFSVLYTLDCGAPVRHLSITYALFYELSGLNTTVLTVITRKGAQRYAFTDAAKTTIDVSAIVGPARSIEELMRDYDPAKGFRSEAARLRALGIADTEGAAPKTAPREGAAVSSSPKDDSPQVPWGRWLLAVAQVMAVLVLAWRSAGRRFAWLWGVGLWGLGAVGGAGGVLYMQPGAWHAAVWGAVAAIIASGWSKRAVRWRVPAVWVLAVLWGWGAASGPAAVPVGRWWHLALVWAAAVPAAGACGLLARRVARNGVWFRVGASDPLVVVHGLLAAAVAAAAMGAG